MNRNRCYCNITLTLMIGACNVCRMKLLKEQMWELIGSYILEECLKRLNLIQLGGS